MALRDVTNAFLRRLQLADQPMNRVWALQCRHYAFAPTRRSTVPAPVEVQKETQDLEESDFVNGPIGAAEGRLSEYDPAENARSRGGNLPPSRYRYRPPRYNRGPLHPHQSPLRSDPASREFVPGPFSLPRLEQTYHDTIASDLMTLSYNHLPPGYERPAKGPRLRPWVGESPYFENRPLRGPRGSEVLRLLRKPITFRNVPELERVTVHTMVKGAMTDSAHIHVAGMALQAITNVRATAHAVRQSVATFGIKRGQHLSATCELEGENMYHFLSKVIDVVMPKIKDWKGVKGSSGDNSGNIAFGFTPEEFALFPEIEVNYDMYPPKMIPGCHVIVHTTATGDRDARMLLTAIGIPFYGKFID